MDKFNIPIFQLQYDDEFREKFHQGCETIFNESFLTNHTMVKKFEKQFATLNNSSFCLGVSSGTAALEIALRAQNIEGREVIVQSNTFIATAISIQNAGGKIKLTDLEDEYYGMCPHLLEKKITSQTGAVVIVHIGGLITPHIEEIVNICKKHNVPLIEDCAQAAGSSHKGVKAGNFGSASSFSFFTTKNMTTGEGGAVITNDHSSYMEMKSIRQFGMSLEDSTIYIRGGSNFKLNEFSALLGILEMDRFKDRIKKREQIAKRYEKNLHQSSWKVLLSEDQSFSSHYKTIIISPLSRDKIKEHFEKNNIKLTGGVYYTPLHKQPVLAKQFQDEQLNVTDFFSTQHICPPCYPELTFEEVDYISEKMLELCS